MSEWRERRLPDPGRAVYAISVAADLSGLAVQTLRLYETHGLITPARSNGGTRRYSGDDVARLLRIATLAAEGINLAGVRRILELEDLVTRLRAENSRLRREQQ
ncbi:MerR family transcriptional regulator [Nocardia bovistercoris]|uniref:MerR family transcriptional regulator n=1 Tax=Nocardia bovistercoris TaxID=2785916 RepID=A0A931IIX6_9NOCA|nr:MerR family transcriptional regulator [Nocardia bovistercoris]MBH0780842.1 MerR family transcriptional regulator [Nocardia bovistercoris]